MIFASRKSFPSLRKCKNCLQEAIGRHKKIEKRLTADQKLEFEELVRDLDRAITAKDLGQAQEASKEVTAFLHQYGRKSFWDHFKEFFIAILIALAVAGVVRQMWFELYEIPTGSMRPTFKENDRVLVVKDAFGINVPFQTDHFYFDPSLVKRGSIVVITGDQLALEDVDTVYFGIFPGKRRYVKRAVAMDGDTVYFYGGRIYGIDKNGNSFTDEIEHIPFISFEGKVDYNGKKGQTVFLKQMNIPIAKLEPTPYGKIISEVKTDDGWQHESKDLRYMDFYGIKNFAMCRLVEPAQVPSHVKNDDAVLYLELKHSPTLTTRIGANARLLQTQQSFLALDAEHVARLASNLYTARFYVRDGYAYRYTPDGPDTRGRGFFLNKKIPDGCYEFYNGIAYEIGFGSIANALPSKHPIYPKTAQAFAQLYNFGIEILRFNMNDMFPSRYAYYRDGDFYALGQILYTKDDPLLQRFIEMEESKKQTESHYSPFVDSMAPDAERIKKYGLKIPEKHYLLLGDNHAMSNDSRFFGTVPEVNLQGSPILTFWPPGARWGAPTQPEFPFFRFSHIVILFAVAILSGLAYWLYLRKYSMKRFEKDEKDT